MKAISMALRTEILQTQDVMFWTEKPSLELDNQRQYTTTKFCPNIQHPPPQPHSTPKLSTINSECALQRWQSRPIAQQAACSSC